MLHNKCTSTRVSIWISVTPWRFTISPWIYYPTVHTVDGILYFFHSRAHYLMTGPSYNHSAIKPSPTPCRRVQAKKPWDDPTSIYSMMLWELWDAAGFYAVVLNLWVPSFTQWAAKTLSYWGKKHELDKKRCLSWFPSCDGCQVIPMPE